ncbi:zeta toxin family protein [Streptomyces sp. NPDC006372]|uniref:zeta toxin family protein n=1 Tax=Streptomyces sp. NPDC006372 TaxID=3155599 RepID=UPI0033B2D64A
MEWRTDAAHYARNWWVEDAYVEQVCRDDPPLKAILETESANGLVSTAHVYEKDGAWRLSRHDVHAQVCLPVVQPKLRSSRRQAYIFIGMPGAGKTTCLRRMVDVHRVQLGAGEGLLVVSADDIREKLPEYAHGLGSGVVQREAVHLTYGVDYRRALESSNDLAVDSIGRAVYVDEWVADLTEIGCDVHVLAAMCAVEVATERMRSRALSTGRFLPSEIISDALGDVEEAADRLQSADWPVASWAVVDTSEDNVPPQLIEGTSPWGIVGQPVVLW